MGQSGSRTVNFPENQSLGLLYLRDSGVHAKDWEGWEECGQARAKVSVPQGKELRLMIMERTYNNLSGLATLRAEDIQHLYIASPQLQDSDLGYLKGLTGLRSLTLSSGSSARTCPLTGEGLVHLKNARSLRRLSICVSSMSQAGLKHLKEMTWLQELTLAEDSTGEKDLADLKEALPDCTVRVSRIPPQPSRPQPVPASLMGLPLPDVSDFGIELSQTDTNGKRILVCFWDMSQRPSRNTVQQLVQQAGTLKDRGVITIAIQDAEVDKHALDVWIEENNVPFPIGMVQGETEKVHLRWGIKSLPWLILTDEEHVVMAEGFAPNGLNSRLK